MPISPPGDLPDPRFKTAFPTLAIGFFTTEPPGKPHIILRSGKIKANRICQGPRKHQIQNIRYIRYKGIFNLCYIAAAAAAAAGSLQSCPTLCDPIDGSPLGSSLPGILQARILEWVAISLGLLNIGFLMNH